MTIKCTCKAEHWQNHVESCPAYKPRPLLTLENIRSGAVPSDAVAVGFLLGENDKLREIIARCYMRMQCADVPREPWHWEVCTTLDNTGIPSALEPGVCACIPLAPRPAKYCSDCGKLIPQGASRDASSLEFPECTGVPRDCPYVYCHSTLKCPRKSAKRTSEQRHE